VGDGAVTAIGRALATRGRALVVLDNVDPKLPGATDAVLRFLDLAGEARLLVTSREPLFLLGEEVIELAPLSLPDSARDDGDAVLLFVERVRALRAEYEPSGDDPRAIAELVRRVRGVPLAIELCASRLAAGDVRSLLSPSDLGARADAQAIAWSFRKLLPWERETLAQCSVFRGGFTVEAAEAVVELPASAGGRRVGDVVGVLLQKSLLQTARADGGRFAICEGIRGHAAGLLDQGVESSGAPWRHAQYYLELASGPLTDLPGNGGGAKTRDALAAERENLEAVLSFAAEGGRRDLVLRAAVALDFLSGTTGLSRAHLALLDHALGTPGNQDGAMVGRALGVRAAAMRGLGRLDEAERDAKSALVLARRQGNTRQVASMHLSVSIARFQLGDLDAALMHAKAALEHARASGDRRQEPSPLQQLGAVLAAMGEAASARAHYEAALDLAVDLEDEAAEARAALGLGSYFLEAGDLERSEASYERGLLIARRLSLHRMVRIAMGYLGVLHFDAGRIQEAERWFDNAVRRSRAVGDLRVEGIFEGMRAAVLATLDLVEESERAFTLSSELLKSNLYFREVIELHEGHLELCDGRAALAEGDWARAEACFQAAEHRIAVAEAPRGETPPLVLRSDDARIAVRILRRALAASGR
jgi:predicted ATPase